MYELLINENMKISDERGLFAQLAGTGRSVIKVTDGGRWAANAREQSVEDLKALICRHFEVSREFKQNHAWITEIDNIITSSKTEQANYDFKQGFIKLDGHHQFDYGVLEKVIATCVGINNIGVESTGFVLVGVSDTKACADRLRQLYEVNSIESNGFYINGIDHEAETLYGSIDNYFQHIKSKISELNFNEKLKQQILKDIKLCDYDGHHLIKIEVKSVGEICALRDKTYLRQGTSTDDMSELSKLIPLISNYESGR